MINRIVKMTFQASKVEEFKSLFEEVSTRIKNSDGCLSLQLLQDNLDKRVFFTYSVWTENLKLENYRKSELFIKTWANTKMMFAEKPEAWSTIVVSELR